MATFNVNNLRSMLASDFCCSRFAVTPETNRLAVLVVSLSDSVGRVGNVRNWNGEDAAVGVVASCLN